MTTCLCGAPNDYSSCCKPYLTGQQCPQTPEMLMRSRYVAYCLANVDYIQKTMQGEAAIGFDLVIAKRWAKRMCWIKLEVINSSFHYPNKGYVEFIATFVENQVLKQMHETSEFIQEDSRWYYIDGVQHLSTEGIKRLISRNSLCPCGGPRKFKNCHEKSNHEDLA